MKKLLHFLLLTIISLLYSCGNDSHFANSILLAADSLMQSRPDSSLYLLEQIPDPQKIKKGNQALYCLLLTQARYKNYILLQNDSLISLAIDYYGSKKDQERLAKSYFYLGCVYLEQRKLPAAIDFYLKAVDIMPEGKDPMFLSMIYSHLGDCYSEQDLNKTALSMYKEAYALCVGRDSLRTCYNLKNIANAFLLGHQWDSTYYYYKKALPIALSLNNSAMVSTVYKNMATLYNEQNKFVDADTCISRALVYLSEGEGYTAACSVKGDIMNSMNKKDSAVYYWKIGARSSNIYVKTSSYNHLFEGYKKMKDWENATVYVDSFILFYDSIQMMNYRAELDELMDNHLIELHKRELSVRNQRIVAGLAVLFLLFMFVLVIVYLWRDARRKKEYMALQQRLMENRAEVMLLNEIPESASNTKVAELHKLEEERFSICVSIFRTTEGSRKLDELKKATAKMQVSIADTYRQVMVSDIRKTFADVMKDLKEHYPGLTNDDLLYCILSLLRCSKFIVLCILDVSSDAIKTRKSRIKNKIDEELFNRMFDY